MVRVHWGINTTTFPMIFALLLKLFKILSTFLGNPPLPVIVLGFVNKSWIMFHTLQETVDDAQTHGDLDKLSRELIPLEELKSILSEKLQAIHEKQSTNTDNSLSLIPPPRAPKHSIPSLYFKTCPFHQIMPEVIQFKIVSFLPEMYSMLPCLSKSFSQLFANFPTLFHNVSSCYPFFWVLFETRRANWGESSAFEKLQRCDARADTP